MQSVEDYLDSSQIKKEHLKIMIVGGIGFFVDAYDLFIIGIAVALIAPLWKLNNIEIGLLGSIALISALIGSFIFGILADKFGRKRIYGTEAILMALGALLSAFSPNFLWLLISRFIIGLGIGGNYPLTAVIMSEYSNKKDRGKLVSLVFSMQALGLIAGPLVALSLIKFNLPVNFSWRLMLGIGAIPALTVIYSRRKTPESPRYASQVLKNTHMAFQSVHTLDKKINIQSTKIEIVSNVETHLHVQRKRVKTDLKSFFTNKKYMLTLFGTAGSWFLIDYAYYGNTISTPILLNSISSTMTLETKTLYTLLIFLVFAFPGYVLSILLMDKLGRRSIQLTGFIIMGISFLLLGIFPEIEKQIGLFLVIYGLSYLFTEFGPNTTTFVMPSELFPTKYRATGHGISSGIGKLGAFVGTFMLPILNPIIGLNGIFIIVSILSFMGIVTTFVLPETKDKSLENINEEITNASMLVVNK
ncbi:MAG: MFS transporter [Candidatus Parvarchaeota archaeon]|nr:MFS transporter [Candidatus Jingweiarchaeum tengchongense]MCW1306226.1 MFS transporter [Candidatus Jingweiarchaeum tengchongense]